MSPPKKKNGLKGTRYASQLIFYAGKHNLMLPADLRKIGKSAHFHGQFLAVCREDPKNMRLLLEKGKVECDLGEQETVKSKREKLKMIKERIALHENGYRLPSDVSEKVHREGRLSPQNTALRESHNGAQALATGAVDEELPAGICDEKDEEESCGPEINKSSDLPQARTSISEEPQEGSEGTAAAKHDEAREDEEMVDDDEAEEDEEMVDDDEIKIERDQATKDDWQQAFIRGEPLPIDNEYCRKTLAATFMDRRFFDADTEFEAVLENCVTQLDPDVVQDAVIDYLVNRLRTPTISDAPIPKGSSSIEEILEILQVLKRIAEDTSIRRASAQMMLHRSVQLQSGGHTHALKFLRELANAKAGNVSQKESTKIYKSYERDYYAGKKWIDIITLFNDDGIVMLLIVAGIGTYCLTKGFTDYQRECFSYVATHLYGIKNLVAALGPNALERYCLNGCLDEATIGRVKDAVIV